MTVKVSYDQALLAEVSARFDLREPNRLALAKLVSSIEEADGSFVELVADLATGVGKTFLMSSLIDYLAAQGVRHVLVVTPGSVIQRKTLENFDEASQKYVAGAEHAPVIITPENFRAGAVASALRDPGALKVFVFNVQQLIRPTDKVSRKVRDTDEYLGAALYDYLEAAEDLFVIADEHHVYHERAKAFSGAVRDLSPIALVGLTATPSQADVGKIVFQYTLGEAIADGHVKVPVIVYRKDGTKDERTQLADACQLLRSKQEAYLAYQAITPRAATVRPVLFVVASNIEHAGEVAQLLAQPGFIGDPSAVLEITSQSSDEALSALAAVESESSRIRAIVSVNMLREGWDVRNIAVIVALRKLASQTLTEQILGRGLRLPFGARTGSPAVDQVDLVAHDSYKQLLAQKDVLAQRIQMPSASVDTDEQGAARPPLVSSGDASFDEDSGAESMPTTTTDGPSAAGASSMSISLVSADGETTEGALLIVEATEHRAKPTPQPKGRVDGAPKIVFPRRQSKLTFAQFTLSDIPDGDAQAAGARFIAEVPTFLLRDAIDGTRTQSGVTMRIAPQEHAEAQQELALIDTVREDLVTSIFRHPGVVQLQAEKNGAKRLVRAFLKGAGVVGETSTAEWGALRRRQAVAGMSDLIATAYAGRKREQQHELVPVELPIEPVLVEPDARDAYNDAFVKHVQFAGWQRNVMPIATFDAGSTEFALAHLLDREPTIKWWLRIYTNGPAFIPTSTDSNYFPDFIALDSAGTFWLIEGKSDKNANDADVLRKKDAAVNWARSVRDDGRYGNWRYVFATERDIKAASGSWASLLINTTPE
ncbi:DEAD/DEAH box helicase family protein [Microbacterium sp. CFBP9023]|uniref:DEAD/DEAH box helicase n=1 Tax=Microbacterium sp. CFBP9023 TaxID=3096535 RepID=UPI002A6A944B|nr:DEAD/DEAH box helicase family protein [Microbacterium sp. CFBP9023]MDY0983979.1 DEAD/DEAH box helicase family protein [Microbacterium sp. CFBP9023]